MWMNLSCSLLMGKSLGITLYTISLVHWSTLKKSVIGLNKNSHSNAYWILSHCALDLHKTKIMADAKAETPVLWPPHVKSWFIGKDSDAGRDWGQEEKGTTEDEMAGWHHRLHGREFDWTPRDGDGQGGLACCDSWGCKESDTTEQLNWRPWHLVPSLHGK